ncbi:MAG: hypothetical protein K5872_13690 [Rhizobiaceae bacterium]|nr:hypothetical protein [Rhizobiaceae bacterium]MCV0407272.1 hypothetical protein [Rhizobiaceae bacterium]
MNDPKQHRPSPEEESRRILGQVNDPAAQGFLMKGADRVLDHVSAGDKDQSDPIEVWGTRIGRTVGVAALFLIALWLLAGMLDT